MWLSSITRMQEHRSSRVQCMGLEAADVLLREMMNPNVSFNDLEDSIQRNQSSHSQTQETGSNNSEGSRSTIRQKGQTRYCADQGVSGKDLPSDLGGLLPSAAAQQIKDKGPKAQRLAATRSQMEDGQKPTHVAVAATCGFSSISRTVPLGAQTRVPLA